VAAVDRHVHKNMNIMFPSVLDMRRLFDLYSFSSVKRFF
jgi:hypothetical protein